MHMHGKNESERNIFAYSFTVVDGKCKCPEDTYIEPLSGEIDRLCLLRWRSMEYVILPNIDRAMSLGEDTTKIVRLYGVEPIRSSNHLIFR